MITKKITTTNNFVVELKEFITGRDSRHIQDTFIEDVEFKQESGKGSSFGLKGSKLSIAQDRAIEAVVVSVDGEGIDKSKSITDQVLDLPSKDYNEVVEAVNEITDDTKKGESTPKI